jgi:hypothetical protein
MSDDMKPKCPPSVSERRPPGRPEGTKTAPDDLDREAWLLVEAVRDLESQETGQKPSVAAACRLIAERGGLVGLVGGDRESVSAFTSKGRPRKWRRASPRTADGKTWFGNDPEGNMIIGHQLAHAGPCARAMSRQRRRCGTNRSSDMGGPISSTIGWGNRESTLRRLR